MTLSAMKKHEGELVLITGGSGFVGHNLCAHFLAHGFRVRNVDLLPFNYARIRGVETVIGDIRSADVMARATAGASYVVHCAAAFMRHPADLVHSVNVEGTNCVLETSKRAGVRRFVYLSTAMVYGASKDFRSFSEDDLPASGGGDYAGQRRQAEELCQSAASALEMVVLRPALTVGKGRLGLFDVIFDWVKSKKNLPIVGNGHHPYQLLDVEDLAEAARLCLLGEAAKVCQTFNVGAGEYTTLRGDLEVLLRHAGFEKRVVSLPEGLSRWLLKVFAKRDMSPLHSWILEAANRPLQLSLARLIEATGWRPRRSNAEALIASYDDYLAHADSLPEGYGFGHRSRWRPGILDTAKVFF